VTSLPQTSSTLLIRTDFSDQAAWQALRTAVTAPNEDEFLADLHFVDDPAYGDLTPEQIVALAPEHDRLVILADKTALTAPGMPLLAVLRHREYDDGEEGEEEGADRPAHEELRVIAEELWSIENNISLANMDWEEFVDAADEDGVFRGF
jgi:hypothetical protein